MKNRPLEKPSLDVLIDQNLHDMNNALAETYYNRVGKYNTQNTMIVQEDLSQEGILGITIAYQSFDPNLGNINDITKAFRTHAYLYINNAMLTYCKKFSHPLSISERAARGDLDQISGIQIVHINQLELSDVEFDIPIGLGVELNHDVEEFFFANFNLLERNLARGYLIEDYSVQGLANKYDMPRSQVYTIIKNLKYKIECRGKQYVMED